MIIVIFFINNHSFLVVNSDYTGPRFDEEITAEFMKELISVFKAQKKLHIKYAYKVIFLN